MGLPAFLGFLDDAAIPFLKPIANKLFTKGATTAGLEGTNAGYNFLKTKLNPTLLEKALNAPQGVDPNQFLTEQSFGRALGRGAVNYTKKHPFVAAQLGYSAGLPLLSSLTKAGISSVQNPYGYFKAGLNALEGKGLTSAEAQALTAAKNPMTQAQALYNMQMQMAKDTLNPTNLYSQLNALGTNTGANLISNMNAAAANLDKARGFQSGAAGGTPGEIAAAMSGPVSNINNSMTAGLTGQSGEKGMAGGIADVPLSMLANGNALGNYGQAMGNLSAQDIANYGAQAQMFGRDSANQLAANLAGYEAQNNLANQRLLQQTALGAQGQLINNMAAAIGKPINAATELNTMPAQAQFYGSPTLSAAYGGNLNNFLNAQAGGLPLQYFGNIQNGSVPTNPFSTNG